MEKTLNIKIIDTKLEIIKLLEQFPIVVSQYLINDVKQIVDANVNIITSQERQAYQESLNKKEENL